MSRYEFSPQLHPISFKSVLILSSTSVFKVVLFRQVLDQNGRIHSSSLPCVLHASSKATVRL
jgi:hypothetical protein